ncbi:MAG TPA: diacylglycerol kinase family protein [Actinomycetota bacterium]
MPSPFGPLVLIVNPRAGRGEVGREMPELERRIVAGRLEYRIEETQKPGDASRLAREAVESGERFVVAVGDDATLNEVVNGLMDGDGPIAEDLVVGAMAGGSGSDFVRTFGLPDQVTTGARHLLGEHTYPIDVARITYGAEGRSRYFVNAAQVGLGGLAVRRAAALPEWLGRGRQFLGFWRSVIGYRVSNLRVRADKREFEERAHSVVIANGQFLNGGMRVSPKSYPGDGRLDVQVSIGPKSQAFTILPSIYRGEHLPDPQIKEMLGAEIVVESDRPIPVEADGIPLGETPVRVTVLKEALRLKI